jgi:hypothetical protein
LAEVPAGNVLADLDGGEDVLLEWKELPKYPVTGLPVNHMPEKIFFLDKPGAAQMTEDSKVYPFLLNFINKDFETIDELNAEERRPLRQFMVSVYLTGVEGLSRKDFDLKPVSGDIKITGRYDNPTANSMNWVGYFKSDAAEETLALKISKGKKRSKDRKESEIIFPIYPGKNHFIDIEPSEEKTEAVKEAA